MTADVPTTRAISDEASAARARVLAYLDGLDGFYGDDEQPEDVVDTVDGGHESPPLRLSDLRAALAQSSDEAALKSILAEHWDHDLANGRQSCGCGTDLGDAHGDLDERHRAHVARVLLAQSSGRGADHALAEQIAQAIEAHLISIESDWQDGMRYAAAIARTFADEVTGR